MKRLREEDTVTTNQTLERADVLYDAMKTREALELYESALAADETGWAAFQCGCIWDNLYDDDRGLWPKDTKKSDRSLYAEAMPKIRTIISSDLKDPKILYARSVLMRQDPWASEDTNELKLAADAGFERAMISLSRRYFDGSGFPKDLAEATKWARAAAKTKNPWASYNLAEILSEVLLQTRGYDTRTRDRASEISQEIRDLIFEAAEKGYSPANYAAGTLYCDRIAFFVSHPDFLPHVDTFKAIEHWKISAKRGHEDSIWRLARVYHHNDDHRDLSSALESYTLLGEVYGRRGAWVEVGKIYLYGPPSIRDPVKSFEAPLEDTTFFRNFDIERAVRSFRLRRSCLLTRHRFFFLFTQIKLYGKRFVFIKRPPTIEMHR
jgi:TPR repeat protein